MAEEKKEVKWSIKEAYAERLGCKYWPYPIMKGFIPCRFPGLRLVGAEPCDLCWRKLIYDVLVRLRGEEK